MFLYLSNNLDVVVPVFLGLSTPFSRAPFNFSFLIFLSINLDVVVPFCVGAVDTIS